MSTLWSGRFTDRPDAEVFEYGRSLSVDRRLFDDDVIGSAFEKIDSFREGVLEGLEACTARFGQ